jgi:hypothetical protein
VFLLRAGDAYRSVWPRGLSKSTTGQGLSLATIGRSDVTSKSWRGCCRLRRRLLCVCTRHRPHSRLHHRREVERFAPHAGRTIPNGYLNEDDGQDELYVRATFIDADGGRRSQVTNMITTNY